jgi:DNA polymerase zeta
VQSDVYTVNAYMRTLHVSIDHALAISYRRNPYDGKTAFVGHITLVKGIPFYGYHVGYRLFLKIYILNPLNMTRLSDLLRQGAVMKRVMQPYESHMQYLAQWMCDYNLYGCAYINCGKVTFRSPVPEYMEMNSSVHLWHDRSIEERYISDGLKLPRQSHCSIEVDVLVKDILNRHDIEERPLHHDFIERIRPLVPDEKLVHSMAGLWRDETRRRKLRMGVTDSDSSPFPPEVLVTMSADLRTSQPGGWIHEEEYAGKIRAIARDEFESDEGKQDISFDNFVKSRSLEDKVQTAFESVEDLYPERLPSLDFENRLSQAEQTLYSQSDMEHVNVDETQIHGFEDDDIAPESETGHATPLKGKRAQMMPEEKIVSEGSDTEHFSLAKPSYARSSENTKSSSYSSTLGARTNSSDLESRGVRKVGDFSHVEEDAFEIPYEFASDIRVAAGRYKRAELEGLEGAPRRKKRKAVRDTPLSDQDMSSRPTSRHDLSKTSGALHGAIHFDEGDGQVSSIPRAFAPLPDNVPDGVPKLSEGPPQDLPKPNSFPRNPALCFPVVKDPNDPSTVFRLSQQSSSSQKESPKNTTKMDGSSQFTNQLESSLSESKITPHPSKRPSLSPTSKASKLTQIVQISFGVPQGTTVLCFNAPAPAFSFVESTMRKEGLPSNIDQYAYYSDDRDVSDRQRDYAGREFKIQSNSVPYLPAFDPTGSSPATFGDKIPVLVDHVAEEKACQRRGRVCKLHTWEIAATPPTRSEVVKWLAEEQLVAQKSAISATKEKQNSSGMISQIDGPTQKNRHGFKYSQVQASTSVQHETQYMSVMSLEVHVNTRGSLVPNPEEDEVSLIFWCVQSDDEDMKVNAPKGGIHVGILVLSEDGAMAEKISRASGVDVEGEASELDLLTRLVDIVRRYDPDIITGYEVHNSSWGYLIERARHKYDMNLCDEFSRTKSQSHGRFGKEADRWGFDHTSTIRVTGRHMINIWRAMRGELNLLQYTMENVVFHLLHRRIPQFAYRDLTAWYQSGIPRDLAKVVNYYSSRVQMDLEILESNELVPRTSEQARLLGVDFFSVFSRGSQFKVESLMFRIAKPENLILISPSRKQVGSQNALECLPLVMEPQSDFYPSPLLVLDFQSLYPSVMIAYNYCYSTFLGRVVNWRGQNKMGFTEYKRENRLLELFEDHINIAPNGIMYVKPEIRKSLLAKMLGEILETRVMVKSGMKADRDDKKLQRLLNNRQLALKLIANVTYGYTSASFSGRMPCSEIADSIVQTGRETLEKTIALIHSVERWGAEVVYGDTDSLFVYLKGRTRQEAFDIGEDIAETITKMNPRPVKLKFEKVYHPCVLLAKKRYVGYKYEHRYQKEPEFDAKGIETVRRDGTPAEQKIEEKALKILFETADLSQVKSYFQSQCAKIMRGKVSIQDFCFAKAVKLGTYSDKGPPPPGALISTRRMLEDPRTEPQYGERVPYVVITGGPGARLIDRCVGPEVLLHDPQSELDAEYYISKNIIPPLERIFNLVGANVRQWYDEMPKFQRIRRIEGTALPANGRDLIISKKTLESYMKSSSCVVCRNKLDAEISICRSCLEQPHMALLTLKSRLVKAERRAVQYDKVCRSCEGFAWGEDVKCVSKDCPVFYSRTRHRANLGNERAVLEPVVEMLESVDPVFDW